MAYNIFKERKKQQQLVVALVILISAIAIINYRNFFSKPAVRQISFVESALPSRININFNVLSSPILQMLKPFEVIGIKFDYEGKTADGEAVSGTIEAATEEDVREKLIELGISEVSLGGIKVGRKNPFTPY